MTNPTNDAQALMRSVIQRIATGPELSKDISLEEARDATIAILQNEVSPVRAAIFLIALRMKRETPEEFRGVLDGIRAMVDEVVADVDHVVDLVDPYDGYNRTLPMSPFLPAVLAECGLRVVSHGLDEVGPKNGITHRHVLQAAGIDVDLDSTNAAARLSDETIGWAYVDQATFCKPLHDLIPLRSEIIKRQVLTTVEVLAKPIAGRVATHFVTGYVHKPYPPIYAMLARHAGFDSALLVRGVEGGIVPSLRQPGKCFYYRDGGDETELAISPSMVGIEQDLRALPLPEDLPPHQGGDEIALSVDREAAAQRAAEVGLAALRGERGPAYDSLVYAGALILHHMQRAETLGEAAEQLRAVLDSGAVERRLR